MTPDFQLLFLANSRKNSDCLQWMEGRWTHDKEKAPIEIESLDRPLDFLSKLWTVRNNPSRYLVHCIGAVPAYLAALTLPKSVSLIVSGVPDSEFPWNRWLMGRFQGILEAPAVFPPRPMDDSKEFPIWCFADWTSQSGVREVLWSFTMVGMAGWKCRLHLFGKGVWQATLRQFADLASTGPQIEFHECVPDQFSGLNSPVMVFSPNQEKTPAWLAGALAGIPVITSAGTTTGKSNGKNLFSFEPLPWKPAAMARKALEILGETRKAGFHPNRNMSLPVQWSQSDCYQEIWRQTGLDAA